MNASCPQCTGAVELTRTNGGIMSGWLQECYHCARCRITIRVEYEIVPDSPETQPGDGT